MIPAEEINIYQSFYFTGLLFLFVIAVILYFLREIRELKGRVNELEGEIN